MKWIKTLLGGLLIAVLATMLVVTVHPAESGQPTLAEFYQKNRSKTPS